MNGAPVKPHSPFSLSKSPVKAGLLLTQGGMR